VRFKNEDFIYHASLTLQWPPLLLVVSMLACENTHSVALGLMFQLFDLLFPGTIMHILTSIFLFSPV